MKITVIVAGTNEPSNSNFLADAFIEGLRRRKDCDVQKAPRLKDVDLEHFSLKHYDPDYEHEEAFKTYRTMIQESDGLVIATPIWNFGVPAHLKNLIDRMASFALDETKSKGTLNGKPVFFIFTGGAPKPAWIGLMKRTTSFVTEALRYYHATPVGTHFEGKCTPSRGEFDLVVDQRPQSIEAVKKQAGEFADIVKSYNETGALPLRQNLLRKCMMVGEKVLKKLT